MSLKLSPVPLGFESESLGFADYGWHEMVNDKPSEGGFMGMFEHRGTNATAEDGQ